MQHRGHGSRDCRSHAALFRDRRVVLPQSASYEENFTHRDVAIRIVDTSSRIRVQNFVALSAVSDVVATLRIRIETRQDAVEVEYERAIVVILRCILGG